MADVVVKKYSDINNYDEVKIGGNNRTFHLQDKNDTDSPLILIYMYVLPKFMSHGIKVGMTKCRMDETFWHAIQSRIKDQKHELALTDEQITRGYGDEREVIYWGICIDANNDSFKDYHVHDEIKARCAGLVEKEQEWFTNVPQDELIEIFQDLRKSNSSRTIYVPRDEQARCVVALKNYFSNHKTGGRFLLNCKMRF